MRAPRRLAVAALMGAFVGIVLLAQACSKDDEGPEMPPLPTAMCNVSDQLYHGNFNSIVDTLSIGPACVNPTDPDDIIFYHQASLALYRYHRGSEEFTVLRQNVVWPIWTLKWHDDGLLTAQNVSNLLIFNSLIDMLSQQSFNMSWPAWSPLPSQMVYNATAGTLAEWFTYIGSTTDFTDRDTLSSYLSGDRAWVSPDTIFHGGQVYSISNNLLVAIVETFGVHHTTAVDQTHFYTADRNTLYYLDAATSTYEVVQEYTNCEGFTHIQYHAGMDKIFATRARRESFAATNALIEVRDLVWLNRDGTVYEEVDLVELLYPE